MVLRIVTDSTGDLEATEAAALGIDVVPLTVLFGEQALLDRVEISPEQFYERLSHASVVPRTSQPSVGRFEEMYARLAAEGATEVLSIHLSSRLSGTFGAARLAAGRAPAGCQVLTLDSMSVAGGLGAMARCAAAIAASGGSAEDAATAVRAMIPRHGITILLDTLEYLQKGGRIGKARALLGSVLNVKPMVKVFEGEVVGGERVRSRARGVDRLYDGVLSTPELAAVTVQHTGSPSEAEQLAARLRLALPDVPVDVRWIGPVVGVYAGPRGIGTVTVQRIQA